jgi:hypothetical protein
MGAVISDNRPERTKVGSRRGEWQWDGESGMAGWGCKLHGVRRRQPLSRTGWARLDLLQSYVNLGGVPCFSFSCLVESFCPQPPRCYHHVRWVKKLRNHVKQGKQIQQSS